MVSLRMMRMKMSIFGAISASGWHYLECLVAKKQMFSLCTNSFLPDRQCHFKLSRMSCPFIANVVMKMRLYLKLLAKQTKNSNVWTRKKDKKYIFKHFEAVRSWWLKFRFQNLLTGHWVVKGFKPQSVLIGWNHLMGRITLPRVKKGWFFLLRFALNQEFIESIIYQPNSTGCRIVSPGISKTWMGKISQYFEN